MSSPPPKHSLSSPTSGNTPHPVILPTPSSSTSVSFRQQQQQNYNMNKNYKLKNDLEQQLLEKQKLLQESNSGIGKNVLARQVSQLQDRLKELDAAIMDNEPSQQQRSSSPVDRLRSLERDLSSYTNRSHPLSPGMSSIRNKEKLLNQRSPVSTASNSTDPLPSPSTSTLLPPPQTHGHDSTSLLPLPPPPTGSTPTKRRSKVPNTDRRNTDIEFATEIGQGLLLEVRKMQALLQEKEEKLRTLENQKADLERAAEAMAKLMRQREENEEKLKEETWNLELAKQELTISVTELQQNLNKANVEQTKLAKQVNELRSEIEHLRDSEHKLSTTIDTMKQRHEQDMSSIRRHAAAIQREKSDQTKQIESLTSELAIAKAQSRIGKHVATDSDTNTSPPIIDDQATVLAVKSESSPSTSPPASPKQTPAAARNQAMEVETLKTSLAHAHRMVSNLRSNLHKEKTEKFEFKKLLAESQETIEQLQNDPRMWVDAGPTRSNTSPVTDVGGGGAAAAKRSHKASSKKRSHKKNVRHRLRAGGGSASQNATADDNSVYSYSSMSDSEESEDEDEDEDEYGLDTTKKKFTPLSSELLSQVVQQKPIMVDAQVNTDISLGDELASSFNNKPLNQSTVEPQLKLELMSHTNHSIAPEDPSIALKATESAIAIALLAARKFALEAAVDASVQCDPTLVQAALDDAILTSRKSALDAAVDSSVQSDASIVEAALASAVASGIAEARSKALASAVNSSVQSDPAMIETALAEAVAAGIASSRSKALEAAIDTSIQSDPEDPSIAQAATLAAIASSRKSALEAAIDTSVQCEEDPSIALAASAAAIAASRSAALQAAIDQETQFDIVSIDSGVQSEPVETKDSDVQYEAHVVDAYVQSEDDVTAGKSVDIQHEVESTDIGIQCEIPVPVSARTTFYTETEDEFFDATSKPSSKRTLNPITEVNNASAAVMHNKVDDKALISPSVTNVSESMADKQDLVSAEKMYSKAEMDALIATAVALAVAKATQSEKIDGASDDVKRHTCDMSNNQDADSAVVSHSSAVSSAARDDEDEGDKEYGEVVVHVPTAEDTITSLPFDELAQRRGDISSLSNQAPSTKQEPELTIGPSIIFAQEPALTDIPQRPTNPPPTALLNRAGLSPTFTDNVSRNKGKAPLNNFDLESSAVPSLEDLQRAAALQVNKRHSLASSISTTNTNEMVQSIRSNNANNAMIGLITQTMIGDWLWKYTRKTMGGGLSEKRHRRYFWIHPYTRTLNWSTSAPGSDGSETKFKTALIENITTVPDVHNATDGTPNVSLLIQTSHRQLKLTAPTVEIHEKWFEAVTHLLARNKAGNALINDPTKKTDPIPNNRSISSGTSASLLNRPSFRRLNDIFHSSAAPSLTTADDHIDFGGDEDDEALEDVRMCCNGKHHVSKLEKDHTHRHQYRKRKSRNSVLNNDGGAISTTG